MTRRIRTAEELARDPNVDMTPIPEDVQRAISTMLDAKLEKKRRETRRAVVVYGIAALVAVIYAVSLFVTG